MRSAVLIDHRLRESANVLPQLKRKLNTQPPDRHRPIVRLAASFRRFGRDSRRAMLQDDGTGNLVPMLTPGPAAAREFQFTLLDQFISGKRDGRTDGRRIAGLG